jgi:hypothetical protein
LTNGEDGGAGGPLRPDTGPIGSAQHELPTVEQGPELVRKVRSLCCARPVDPSFAGANLSFAIVLKVYGL